MNRIIPDVWGVLYTGAKSTHIKNKYLGWREEIVKAPQKTQPIKSLSIKRSNVIFPRKITRKRYTKNIKER